MAALQAHPIRELLTVEGPYPAYADRQRALFGSWYEFFPRSEGATLDAGRQGHQRHLPDRRQAARRGGRDGLRRHLPAADPPDRRGQPQGPQQHADPGTRRHRAPRGRSGRRTAATTRSTPTSAPSRTSTRSSSAPTTSGSRSPSTSPSRRRPTTRGSPSHPQFFTTRADGTIAYAENPPKKYQDIYPINFDNDPVGICREVLRVVKHWMSHGVRIFRVDNPHTKPVAFWEWLLKEIRAHRPRRDVPVRGVHPAADDARASARSASTSATPTSPGATPSGSSRSTSARSPTSPTT